MKLPVVLFMVFTVLFNSGAHIILKYNTRVDNVLSKNINPFMNIHISVLFLFGALCFGISIFFYQLVLRTSELSVAFSILTGSAYTVIIIYSVLMFKEKLRGLQYIGIVLVFIGLFLLLWRYAPQDRRQKADNREQVTENKK